MDAPFAVADVAPGVRAITLPMPGNTVNIYLIDTGKVLALVDSGYRTHVANNIVPALASIGRSIDDVAIILNTHGHPDHAGGNAEVKRRSRARIWLHAADKALAGSTEAHIASDTDLSFGLRALGDERRLDERRAYLSERVEAFVVDKLLKDGDRVDLGGGCVFDVISTPGHSHGSVCFWREADGLAIAGDAVQGYGTKTGTVPLYFDPAAYVHSLGKIATLRPQILCMGHAMVSLDGGAGSTAVRRGAEVERTLEGSRRATEAIARLCRGTPSATLRQRIAHAAQRLEPPFNAADSADAIDPAVASTLAAHFVSDSATRDD